jgi:hypothetical protein
VIGITSKETIETTVYQAYWVCIDFSSNLFAYHLFSLSSVHRYRKMSRVRQSAPER